MASNYSTYENWVIYNTSNTIVTRKGFDGNQIIMVLNNDGSEGESRSFSLDPASSGFVARESVTDVLSCTNLTANGTGWLEVSIQGGLPQALYPTKNLADTTFCIAGTPISPVNSTSTSASPTSTHKSAATSKYQQHSAVSILLASLVVAAAQYIFCI